IEIFVRAAHFVWIAKERTDQPLVEWLKRDDVLAIGEYHTADRDLVHVTDRLADHRESIMTDLAVGAQIIGPDQVARIDLGFLDKLVDVDGARRLQRQLLELL